MTGEYYVYCWTNTRNDMQYIGKGRRYRAYTHVIGAIDHSSARLLSTAMAREGLEHFQLTFLATGLTESEAFDREADEIRTRDTKWPMGYNKRGGRKLVFYGPRRRRGPVPKERKSKPPGPGKGHRKLTWTVGAR